jgi:fucose permease
MISLRLRQSYPAWIGVALAFYAFIAIGMVQSGLGVLLPSILAAFKLTPAAVTPLFISQFLGYVVAALNSNSLSNRIGLARMLLLASITLAGALSIYAIATQWFLMIVAGVFFGWGIGLIDAGINTFVITNHHRNANLMGFLHAFCGIGALLGPSVASLLLALGIGWRLVYLVFTGTVILMIAGMFWVIWSDYKPMNVPVKASNANVKTDFRIPLSNPTVLVTSLFLLIYVGTEASLGNWVYTLQTVTQKMSPTIAGYSISGYWLGLSLGRLGMGPIVRRLGATRTIDYSLGLLFIGLAIWWLLPSQIWTLALIGFALAAIFPTTIWTIPQRIPSGMIAGVVGFLTSVGNLGAALIPTLIGWIADKAGLNVIPTLMLVLVTLMIVLQFWLNNNKGSSNLRLKKS